MRQGIDEDAVDGVTESVAVLLLLLLLLPLSLLLPLPLSPDAVAVDFAASPSVPSTSVTPSTPVTASRVAPGT